MANKKVASTEARTARATIRVRTGGTSLRRSRCPGPSGCPGRRPLSPHAAAAGRGPEPGRRCHHARMAGRVLLVEDDTSIGEALVSSLRSHAYDVAWARTGAAALARAAAAPVDLVLLDLGLPDLDGVEVCRQLRATQPGCVLVMLTARSAEMDVVVGLEAGADDYLVKPVRLAELHARLRAHLRRGGSGGTTGPAAPATGDPVGDRPRRRAPRGGRAGPPRPQR